MYQVISLVNGVHHSEGFYDEFQEAKNYRDSISERFWNCDQHASVFVVELNL